jgi:hypothetical protein
MPWFQTTQKKTQIWEGRTNKGNPYNDTHTKQNKKELSRAFKN